MTRKTLRRLDATEGGDMIDKETHTLVLELRNALAAAMWVIAADDFHGTKIDAFLAEARKAGVRDGIGIRAGEWLRTQGGI